MLYTLLQQVTTKRRRTVRYKTVTTTVTITVTLTLVTHHLSLVLSARTAACIVSPQLLAACLLTIQLVAFADISYPCILFVRAYCCYLLQTTDEDEEGEEEEEDGGKLQKPLQKPLNNRYIPFTHTTVRLPGLRNYPL
jgi:membrane protein implicated in regulation of membrane protease activity